VGFLVLDVQAHVCTFHDVISLLYDGFPHTSAVAPEFAGLHK
jgi:hypothetical protein